MTNSITVFFSFWFLSVNERLNRDKRTTVAKQKPAESEILLTVATTNILRSVRLSLFLYVSLFIYVQVLFPFDRVGQ